MGDLGDNTGTSYPAALDTNATLEVDAEAPGKTKARAAVPNDHAAAIVSIQTELGTDPAGTKTDVKSYLQTEHQTDGTHGAVTATSITATSMQMPNEGLTQWPSFSVHKNGVNQSISPSTYTKVTWSTELFDTNSDFASDRFTPTVAGKYLLCATLYQNSPDQAAAAIYKNGSKIHEKYAHAGTGSPIPNIVAVVDANGSSDYFEIFTFQNGTSSNDLFGTAYMTFWTGCRIG